MTATNEKKKKLANFSIIALSVSSILSILGGANDFIGYFTKVGLPALALSIISGTIVARYLPDIILTKYKRPVKILGLNYKNASKLLGLLVIVSGVAPYLWLFASVIRWQEKGYDATIEGSGIKSNYYWQKAADGFTQLGFEQKAQRSKVFLAQSYYLLGNVKTATSLLSAVDSSSKQSQGTKADIYLIRSNIQKSQGQLTAAEISLQQAMELVEKLSNAQATAFMNYALLLEFKGPTYKDEVAKYMAQAKAIFQANGYKKGIIISLLNLASVNQYEPAKAQRLLDTAANILQQNSHPDMEVLLYADYGLLFQNNADVTKAEQYYRKALDKARSTSDIAAQADIIGQMAFLDIYRSDDAQALQHIKQAKSLTALLQSEDKVNKLQIAKLERAQAGVTDALGDEAGAESLYQSALDIYNTNTDVMGEIETRLSFASFYQNHRQVAKAQMLLNSIEGILAKDFSDQNHPYLVIAYNNLGKAYKDAGDLKKSLDFLQKSVNMAKAINNKFLQAQAMENLAIVTHLLGIKTSSSQGETDTKEIFQSYKNASEQAVATLNKYLRANTWSKQQFMDTASYIFGLTDDPTITRSVKNQLLLSLQVDDIANTNIIKYKTKLTQLMLSINRGISNADYGRCNLNLGLVANRLGNTAEIASYANAADSAAQSIPYPNCILYFKKIALLRFQTNDVAASVNQFFKCIEISIDKPETVAKKEIVGDLGIISQCWNRLNNDQRNKCVQRLNALKNNSSSPALIDVFERFIHGIN